MNKQDREALNYFLKEYTPKYTVGQNIRYKGKIHTIEQITIGFDRFGNMELQYKTEYKYTRYDKAITTKNDYISIKEIDRNSKEA